MIDAQAQLLVPAKTTKVLVDAYTPKEIYLGTYHLWTERRPTWGTCSEIVQQYVDAEISDIAENLYSLLVVDKNILRHFEFETGWQAAGFPQRRFDCCHEIVRPELRRRKVDGDGQV